MTLTSEQRLSAGWRIVKVYANERLTILRGRLEGDLSHDETLRVRAGIRELKQLINIENPEQEIDQNGTE